MKTNKVVFLGLLFVLGACSDYTPKPFGYARVVYPEKSYHQAELTCPFTFEIPDYSSLKSVQAYDNYKCWYNIEYPQFNATLHLTYREVRSKNELDSLREDSYQMAFKHISMAEEIVEREILDTAGNQGMIYDLEGKTATPFNFYISNNSKHFLRGSFYFDTKTNQDSVAPIYDFLRKDIMHTIETFKWK